MLFFLFRPLKKGKNFVFGGGLIFFFFFVFHAKSCTTNNHRKISSDIPNSIPISLDSNDIKKITKNCPVLSKTLPTKSKSPRDEKKTGLKILIFSSSSSEQRYRVTFVTRKFTNFIIALG